MEILDSQRVLEIRLGDGETLPIIGTIAGAPLVLPTVYAASILRMGGRSPNTIWVHLRAIMIARFPR